MSIKHFAGIVAITVLTLQGCANGKSGNSGNSGTHPAIPPSTGAAIYGDDPVVFKKRLDEARAPFDQCVDKQLPKVPAIPGDDQTVVDVVMAICRGQLSSIDTMLDKSHLRFDPKGRKKVIDDVVAEAEDRIVDAH